MADDYADDMSTTGYLPTNGSVRGRIDSTEDQDWFRLDLQPGAAYQFSARSDDGSEPLIYVHTPSYQFKVPYSNSSDAYKHYSLSQPFSWVEDDRNYLFVRSSHTGGYTLGVTQLADDYRNDKLGAQTVGDGVTASAQVDYWGDKEYFRLVGKAGMTYKVTLTSDISAPAGFGLTLADWGDRSYSDAPIVGTSRVITFKPTHSQDYYFVTDSHDTGTLRAPIPYRISVSTTDAEGPEVVSTKGSIDGPVTLTFNEPIKYSNASISMTGRGQWSLDSPDVTVSGNTIVLRHHGLLSRDGNSLHLNGDITDLQGNAIQPYAREQQVYSSMLADGTLPNPFYWGAIHGEKDQFNTAVLLGRLEDWQVAHTGGDRFELTRSDDGSATLTSIERVYFTEGNDALLLSVSGNAGKAFRLYQAVFDRAPDKAGMGFWIYHQEQGMSLRTMAEGFMAAPEFSQRYGAHPTNAQFVDSLYHNVLHRDGEAAGVAFHIANLERGMSRADVLTGFSESAENVAATAELIGDGFVYTHY